MKLSASPRPALLQFAAGLLLLLLSLTRAAELRGRATDSVTGKTLPGAAVSLTPVPAGVAVAVEADLFGGYTFTGVAAGSYTMRASHPGYVTFSEARTFLAADLATRDIPLVPLVPGDTRIDLTIQVFDTGTGRVLKDVPVRVQRYNLLDNSVLEETISPMPKTNVNGTIILRSQPKGWYTFRFNHASDGTQVPFYRAYDVSTKRKLEKHHNIMAQLLPATQSLKIRIVGPDPVDPGAGNKPLRDVALELAGYSQAQTLPPDFVPNADDARDFLVQIMQTVQGRTDANGEFTFDGMPPVGLICTAKRPGWRQSQGVIVPAANGTLPAVYEQTMSLQPGTNVEVSLTAPYRTDHFDGMPVKLEGIEGTNTAGIERTAISFELGPTPEFPDGATRAEFLNLLPGRYRASVDANLLLFPARALEDATVSVKARFLGEVYFEASMTSVTRPLIELKPVPATIRGRFFKAESRAAESHSQSEAGLGRYAGPAYRTAAQTGIEFTESALADYLLPGSSVVSVAADDDGVFALSVLPGTWGVKIPSADGYFGSNYRAVNTATGDITSLGWPYAINPDIAPFIPLHPFGSLGIPINSGDDLDLDLYVRRQVYTLNGQVNVDPDSQAQDRVIARTETATLPVAFSHLAEVCEILFDGSTASPNYLQPKPDLDGDGILPGSGAFFRIEALRGSHTITLRNKLSSNPHFAFPSGTVASVVLPDYGSPGAGGRHVNDLIPMEDAWEKLAGVPDPFTCDYQNGHTVEMRFFGKGDDGMGGFHRVLRFTRTRAHFALHPDLGDRLFVLGDTVPWLLMKGDWTLWRKEGADWYKKEFTLSAGSPATHIIEFDLISEWGGASDPPPTPAYNLRLRGENFHDPNYRPGDLTVRFDDAVQFTTPSAGDRIYSKNGYTGSFVPDEILNTGAGQRWVSASGNNADPKYRLDVTAQTTTPEVTVTLPLKRGSQVKGRLLAHRAMGGMEHSLPLQGATVTLRNRFGVFRASVPTVTANDATAGTFSTVLPSAEVLFVEVELNGYAPLRQRVEANQDFDGTSLENLDFELGDLTLDALPEPSFPASELEATFDRRGLFLVGVRKGKNTNNLFANDEDILCTYNVKADSPARRTLTRPRYDEPTGAAGGDEVLEISDPVEALYIVDPRSFPGNPTAVPAPPALPHVMYAPPARLMADDPDKPNPLYPREMQDWIQKLLGAFPSSGPPAPGRKNMFFIRRSDVSSTALPGPGFQTRASVTGKLDLASLPPGLYEPWIVARTKRGAWMARQWSPPNEGGSVDITKNYLSFYGMTLPKWLNGIADTLGTINAAQSGIGSISLDAILTDGSISLEPEIEGDITVNANKTLKYNYDIGASFNEGADTPAVGLLTLGAGFTGLTVSGKLKLEVNGSSSDATSVGHPALTIGAEVAAGVEGVKDKQKNRYVPTAGKAKRAVKKDYTQGPFKLNKLVGLTLSGTVGVALPHRTDEPLTPLHMKITQTTSGGVSFPATVDLTPFAVGIPAVGPAIASLGRADVLKVEADYEPGVGAELTRSLTTRYTVEFSPPSPRNSAAGMLDDVPRAQRRGVLGEEHIPFTVDQEFALLAGLNTALHIGIQAPGGALGIGARAGIETNGSKNSSIGIPSLRFAMNRFGDWPLIRKVTGTVSGTWEAYLRAFIFKFTRSGEWASIEIDQPFNTYEVIKFVPYEETETSSSLTTEPPIEWCALEPHMAGRYSGFCGYATATAGGAAGLAVLDPGGPGGAVQVKFSKETAPGVWSAPVTVASASAVTAVAMHPLASGSWMLVWAEIPAGSLTAMAPPTTLKFSTSATGVTWSAPATLTTTAGTVFDFRLVPMSTSRLGMFFLQSKRGPEASVFDLGGAIYAGGAWGAVSTLFPDGVFSAWDVAGPGFTGSGPARLVFATPALGTFATSWDGAAMTPPEILDPWKENTQCRITAAPGSIFTVAAQRSGGGIALFKKSGPPPFAPLTPVFTTRQPQEIEIEAVTSGATTHHFMTWTEGAATRNLAMAWLNDAGAVLAGPFDFTTDTPGRYTCLRARPIAGSFDADLFTMFENGGTSELRVFGLSETTGLRVTDRDGDTLADMAELRIVDASATDSIKKIDDVTAAADFDGDTYCNGIEIAAGTDPLDANSFPASRVEITTGADTARELDASAGSFIVSRTGSSAAIITVGLAFTGTAGAADHAALPASVTLAAGVSALTIFITPIADTTAEGSETVIATVQAGAGYSIGTSSIATVTIEDTPFDTWRFTHFTAAEQLNAGLSGPLGDAESDSTTNLLEYAFDMDPKNGALTDLPIAGTVIHPTTMEKHLALSYLRRKDDLELVYIVQIGSNLTGWTDATAADVDEIIAVDNNDGTETITIRDKTPLSTQPRRFLRVEVRRVN